MKTIGFIDYFLSEWHANNYPARIAEAAEAMGKAYAVAYAWAEREVSPYDGITTAEWCETFGARMCGSIAEVCEKSDCLIVLSPDNPENHLKYAREVLRYGKPTYIDKTFAPDLKTAREIFDLSERYGAPMFSTSALGCADELQGIASARSTVARGGGSSYEIYAIHLVEMVVCAMGSAGRRVMALTEGERITAWVDYGGGRWALVDYEEGAGFSVTIDGERRLPIASDFFGRLIRDVLNMFETGAPAVPKARTLYAAALRDALLAARAQPGVWQPVQPIG